MTVLGAKPVDLMFTVFVALKRATAKPAPARAHTAVAVSNALRIAVPPQWFDGYVWNGLEVQKMRSSL